MFSFGALGGIETNPDLFCTTLKEILLICPYNSMKSVFFNMSRYRFLITGKRS